MKRRLLVLIAFALLVAPSTASAQLDPWSADAYAERRAEAQRQQQLILERRAREDAAFDAKWAAQAPVRDAAYFTALDARIARDVARDVALEQQARESAARDADRKAEQRQQQWAEFRYRLGESWRRQAEEARRLYALQQLNRINCTSNVVGTYTYTNCW